MAVPEESTSAPPPPWTLIQGWRSRQPLTGGHTFILVAQHGGKVLTLESNNHYSLDGVGFRGLGNAESFPDFSPPAEWWLREEVWDWEKIRTTYPHHRLARLKVTQLQWRV
ncbi:MAG: 1,4-beta-xylanase [Myxococcaceae bacterium]|nr:1,4-beta-xylanase [Myxococcaceae bacterium]